MELRALALDVHVVESVIPTGAATSANQELANTSLGNIDANTTGLALQTGANTFLDKTVTGSITALNDTVEIDTNGCATTAFQISGTWAGTITFEATINDLTWFSKTAVPHSGAGANSTTTTANTQLIVNTSGVAKFRLRRSVATSGTATVHIRASAGPAFVTPISANINNFLVAAGQTGTWTVQPGNTANTTPWLSTINQGGNSAQVSAANALKVDNSAVTQPVSLADGPQLDGFFRLRTSQPQTLFESKLVYDSQPLLWDDVETSGSGTTSTHSTFRASQTLAVSASTAGTRTRQTFRRFNYQSGKSQLVLLTAVPGAGATGITKRWGYFDDSNGIYFELNGTSFSINRRTNATATPVDNSVAQASFNGDPLNGTGASGLTIDFSKAQIFFVDFQWLGVGRIRTGVIIGNTPVVAHTFYGTNTLSSITMSTPNLPIRYSISNSGAGGVASLECICSTVISESGSRSAGTARAIDRAISGLVTGVGSTAVVPVISMRLRSGYLGASVDLEALSVINTTDSNFRWALILNPTIAGVDAASWTTLTNSAIEYDVSRTATNTISGGTVIAAGYTTDLVNAVSATTDNIIKLGSTIAGVSDQLVLVAQNLSASNETYYGSITFRESF